MNAIEIPNRTSDSVVVFDATKHLCTGIVKHVTKMSDIHLDDAIGVSGSAFTRPFRLFSDSAITAMRSEVLNEAAIHKHSFSSNINPRQIRGYGPEIAPFTFAAWKHPETLRAISEAAGIEVVPVMDYEIGHVNYSTPDQTSAPVVDWHVDSYPFVCVLMLSDCKDMKGGETTIKTGTGDVVKVGAPALGFASVLQGRYITHKALRAYGGQERITMVTSFRPKSTLVRDDTDLSSVRPVSDLQELYYQFVRYRMKIAAERIKHHAKEMEEAHRNGKRLDAKKLSRWLGSMEEFHRHTKEQIVEEHLVVAGQVETST